MKNQKLESRNAFLATDNEVMSKDKNVMAIALGKAEMEAKGCKARLERVVRENEELKLMNSHENFKLHLDKESLL